MTKKFTLNVADTTKTEAKEEITIDSLKAEIEQLDNTEEDILEDEPESVLTIADQMPTDRPRSFYIASNWHIETNNLFNDIGDLFITAVNMRTNDRFEGTMPAFKDMLKGL